MSNEQQQHIDNIKQILIKAQSNDNTERNANEELINQMMAQDNVSLIQLLMMIVNEKITPGLDAQTMENCKMARMLASIVFKNALYMGVFGNNQKAEHKNSVWFQIPEITRGHIRDALLTSLGGGTNDVCFDTAYMKDICLCISTIATIEIPEGKWDDFVDIMAKQGMQDQQQLFKFAGIYNLGLVMDVLEGDDIKQNDYIKTWDCMLSNINPQNNELTLIVSQAISRLSSLTHLVFHDENYKQKIMYGMFELLKIQNFEILSFGLQGLNEIVRLNYELMEPYLNSFFEMTQRFLNQIKGNDDEEEIKIGMLMIEVWNQLCEEELLRKKDPRAAEFKIIENYDCKNLTILFSNCIQFTGFSADDHSLDEDNDGTICIAAVNGLYYLSQTAEQGVVLNLIFEYVQQCVRHLEESASKTWIGEYMCVMALNSCVEGPTPQQLHQVFSNVIGWIFERAYHPEPRIRCVTAHLLHLLAEFCPQLFVLNGSDQISNFYTWFQKHSDSESQHPKIVIQTMNAMQQMFVSLSNKNNNFNVNVLNNQFTEIMSIGIRNILKVENIRDGHIISLQDSVNTICEKCDYKNLKNELCALCNDVLTCIENDIFPDDSKYTMEQKEHLINGLGGLLQVIIARLEQEAFNEQMFHRVMNIVQQIANCDSMRQGMLLILNGTINSLNDVATHNITDWTLKHIEETIDDAEKKQYRFDVSCRRMATALVQDIVTCLQGKSVAYIQRMINFLNIVLESDEITTDVKVFAIGALGDLCLMCENQFFEYLQKTMDNLVQAGKMSLEEDTSKMVEDDKKDIDNIRTAIVEALVNILNGIKSPTDNGISINSSQNKQNLNHITNMYFYIEGLIQRPDLTVKGELAQQVIDLYCDIKMLCGDPKEIQDPEERQLSEVLNAMINRQTMQNSIHSVFGPYHNQIVALDDDVGLEALNRFNDNQIHMN